METVEPPRTQTLIALAAALVSAALYAFTMAVPALKVIGLICCPVPIVLCGTRYGWQLGMVATLGASALLFLLEPVQGLFFFCSVGLISLVLIVGFASEFSFNTILMFGCGALLISQLSMLSTKARSQDQSVLELTMTRAEAAYENFATNVFQDTGEEEGQQALKNFLIRTFPAQLFLDSFLKFLVTLWLCDFLLMRTGYCDTPIVAFSQWRLPEQLVWVLILSAGGFLLSYRLSWRSLDLIFLNTTGVVASVYLIQGLAIVRFFFLKWGLGPILQIVGFFILLIQPLIMVVTGVFDIWIDFRNRFGTEVSEEEE